MDRLIAIKSLIAYCFLKKGDSYAVVDTVYHGEAAFQSDEFKKLIEAAEAELETERTHLIVLQRQLDYYVLTFNKTNWLDPSEVEASTRVYMALRVIVGALHPETTPTEQQEILSSLVTIPMDCSHYYYTGKKDD